MDAQSLQAAQSARTELGHLVAAASDELAEAYSQSLEEHVQGVASAIPAIVSEGLAALGEQTAPSSETGPLSEMTPPTEFLLSDEAAHADWPVFAESPQCKAVFGEAQQAAILANNARVHAVFAEIVPQTISAEQFWVRWRLWCFLLPLQRADQPRPIASRDSEPQLRVAMRDSKSLDAVSVSLAARPEEWDDWE